jgi:hypothetical protein
VRGRWNIIPVCVRSPARLISGGPGPLKARFGSHALGRANAHASPWLLRRARSVYPLAPGGRVREPDGMDLHEQRTDEPTPATLRANRDELSEVARLRRRGRDIVITRTAEVRRRRRLRLRQDPLPQGGGPQ